MMKIGVLALQGAVAEHMDMLQTIEGVQPIMIKNREQLAEIDGLILPGGESTTIGKLLAADDMISPLRERAAQGMPLWGTCAGMILLAKEIEGQEKPWLELMDISVIRNGYGGQLDSFSAEMLISAVSDEKIPMVFIRAPYIKRAGENVRILAVLEGRIIAAEQDNILVTSFHPELTQDNAFHKYFVKKIKNWKTVGNI